MNGNTQEALDFLSSWAPNGPWQITAIYPDGKITTRVFGPPTQKEMKAFIQERQGKENLYFTVNPLIDPKAIKPKKTDIRGLAALHVDLDPRAGEDFEIERQRALKKLLEFKPQPTIIMDSGGGFQGFWMLEEEVPTGGSEERAVELEAYNLQLEVLLQADSCHNIDRIMRLPGTINVPNAKKLKKGRQPALAKIVERDLSRRYKLSEFIAAPRIQTSGGTGTRVEISGNLASIDLDELPSGISTKTKALIVNGDDPDEPTKYGSRSEALWAAVCQLVRGGASDDQIAAIILDPDYGISGHILDQPRPQQYAARQIQRAREEAIDPYLLDLNDKHAVIEDIGGKCRVISEVPDDILNRSRLSLQTFEDFRNRYMHLHVIVGTDKDGKDVKMPLGKWWLQNPSRRQYEKITFAPGKEVKGAYNMWQGFACEARPGDCSKLLKHIRENVCSGIDENNEYLIGWMAKAVQEPDSPGHVAVVLRGRMGTGKGFMAKAFGSLWGRHYLQVTNSKHLVGSFNHHLRDVVVLFADEAFFAGDKKHESLLKTMVTEDTLIVEKKGVDAENAANFIHMMMASNDDWVVPAGLDERRFFVLDVAADQMQNANYFKDIQKEMDNGGREAFLHYLMNYDLSAFEVRNFPRTAALQDQKIMSMSPEQQWWFEKLVDGSTSGAFFDRQMPKEEVQNDYLRWMERQKQMRRVTPVWLSRFLSNVLPDGWPKKFQAFADVVKMGPNGQEYMQKMRAQFYAFPSLSAARKAWDDKYGGPYDWPDDNMLEDLDVKAEQVEFNDPF